MKKKVYQAAITYLSMREYTRRDLHKKLGQKGYPDDIIGDVLEELSAQNLQSDLRFVESYVRMRKRQGYGFQRIRRELEAKGVESHFIQPSLEEMRKVWQEHIFEVWQKKFHSIKPETLSEKAKQLRFLQYRGFTLDQIQWVWRRDNQ